MTASAGGAHRNLDPDRPETAYPKVSSTPQPEWSADYLTRTAARAVLPDGEVLFFPQDTPRDVRAAVASWMRTHEPLTVIIANPNDDATSSAVVNWSGCNIVSVYDGADPDPGEKVTILDAVDCRLQPDGNQWRCATEQVSGELLARRTAGAI